MTEWALAVTEISQAIKREQEIEKMTKEQQKKIIVQKHYEEWLASKVALEKERKSKQQKEMTEKAAQEKEVHIGKFSQLLILPFKNYMYLDTCTILSHACIGNVVRLMPMLHHRRVHVLSFLHQECSATNAHVTCIFFPN